ncbi:hypothetical protein chiPu_0021725, partial [Chiloscyllium punctatum]|nr:hypothetical protein [Chiloscyllium punctatum]
LQMANLAFLRGDLLNAEKLFKAAMSQLLQSGTSEDDNAMIEMSLKLCNIYVSTEQHSLAVEGYKWCIETLEEKVQREKDVPEDRAYEYATRASNLARETSHPDQCVILSNLARVLMHRGDYHEARCVYEEALTLAESSADKPIIQHIRNGMEELQAKAQQSQEVRESTH